MTLGKIPLSTKVAVPGYSGISSFQGLCGKTIVRCSGMKRDYAVMLPHGGVLATRSALSIHGVGPSGIGLGSILTLGYTPIPSPAARVRATGCSSSPSDQSHHCPTHPSRDKADSRHHLLLLQSSDSEQGLNSVLLKHGWGLASPLCPPALSPGSVVQPLSTDSQDVASPRHYHKLTPFIEHSQFPLQLSPTLLKLNHRFAYLTGTNHLLLMP